MGESRVYPASDRLQKGLLAGDAVTAHEHRAFRLEHLHEGGDPRQELARPPTLDLDRRQRVCHRLSFSTLLAGSAAAQARKKLKASFSHVCERTGVGDG